MSGEIVTASEKYNHIKAFLESDTAMHAIRQALPRHIDEGVMLRTVLTAITKQPKLLECQPASIAKAVMEASQLGLMPNGVLGHGHLVPFKDQCTFIPGYQGLIDLAMRSGKLEDIRPRAVYSNDYFRFRYGLDPDLEHIDARQLDPPMNRGELIAVYCVAWPKDGKPIFEVMYLDEVEKHRKFSKQPNGQAWMNNYEAMALKTVVRKICKYLPLSTELTEAVNRDEMADAGLWDELARTEPEVPEEKLGAIDRLVEEQGTTIDVEPVRDDEPVPVEEEVPDPAIFEGTGRISNDEDQKFLDTMESLAKRAEAVNKGDLYHQVFMRELGTMGYEQLNEIRNRMGREQLYKTMRLFVHGWEQEAKE